MNRLRIVEHSPSGHEQPPFHETTPQLSAATHHGVSATSAKTTLRLVRRPKPNPTPKKDKAARLKLVDGALVALALGAAVFMFWCVR